MNIALSESLKKLNEKQLEAVNLGDTSSLILSVAGSGKTSVLTSRIAYLIHQKNVDPQNILAVTFTNKAAKEMLSRLNKFDINTNNMWVGTFHGLCNRILRLHATELSLKKNFYIMDTQEQASFIKRMLRNNGYDPKVENWDRLQHFINDKKEAGIRSKQLTNRTQECLFYEMYENACNQDSAVDFAELLLRCYELICNNEKALEFYANKFKYILVDEFQDTNQLQYKWLKKIASVHKCVFAVGDDDQCLPKGTLISTPDGKKNIEDILVGDTILSKIGIDTVQKTVSDKFERAYNGNITEITLDNNTVIQSTPEHVWFTSRKLDDNANINFNDTNIILTLCAKKENQQAIHSLELITHVEKDKNTLQNCGFHFKHDSFLNLFILDINSIHYSELVEKAELIQSNLPHVNLIFKASICKKLLSQTKAHNILPGDILVDDSGNERIVTSIQNKIVNTTVYDLNIDNTHNYIANGILTHNSIYSFRGADHENMNSFKKDFYPVEIIKLEKNYRSYGNILKVANSVIVKNTKRQLKQLHSTKEDGEKVFLYKAFNDQVEAGFIAERIKKIRRQQVPYKEIAILYRTNAQSRNLEKALTSHGIPFVIYGGFRFFDRQEVKHAMAYLRLMHNPHDNLAFSRVVNFPARGIGETSIKKLERLATEQKISLWEASNTFTGKAAEKIQNFKQIITDLSNYTQISLSKQVELVLDKSTLEKTYHKDEKDGQERLDNLYELISAAEIFTAENKNGTIDDFLAFSVLETDSGAKKRDDSIDSVKLMTVHSSKGLEFHTVFINGVEEQFFPHVNSLNDPTLIEEERRLMYVAITRAKENLYLTLAEERMIHGQTHHMYASRFLNDIPKDLLDDVT